MRLYVGVDGGASKTEAIILNEKGVTINKVRIDKGSNLKIFKDLAVKRISELIEKLCREVDISLSEINAFGFGLAAASYDDGRELLFKELDRIKVSERSLIINDAEAAYKICCPDNIGVLVTIGTGIICMGKNLQGELIRVAGLGHHSGDKGSGYWIGKECINKLAINEAIILHDNDIGEIAEILFKKYKITDLNKILDILNDDEDSLTSVASIAREVIELKDSNKIARNIIQEATFHASEYINYLLDMLDYSDTDNLILFGNGSIIRSSIYRELLNEELSFNFPKITWAFSELSASYGAAVLSALTKDNISIELQDILKGEYLVSS